MTASRRSLLVEVLGTVLVVLLLIRLVVQSFSGVWWDLPLVAVPVLFMWAPVWVLRRRGVDPDRYPLALPAFCERGVWRDALVAAGWAVLLLGPPYLIGYHVWHTSLLPGLLEQTCEAGWSRTCGLARTTAMTAPAWRFPAQPLQLVAYHLLFVAVPEELFYRGYVQSRLDEVWAPRWTLLGARLGPGWLVTCVVFALGHSLVAFQWWHAAIVFPSLVFGWLRARTGGIVAGAVFHAWANIMVGTLDVVYGLAPP